MAVWRRTNNTATNYLINLLLLVEIETYKMQNSHITITISEDAGHFD